MAAAHSGAKFSILVAEDDPAAREISARMIAMQFPEAAVYSARDGAAGLELFKKHAPQIVVTDISMPVKNGIEMAKEIKSLQARTRFIVLTAHSDRSFLDEFGKIGFRAYLMKPIDLDLLMRAIEECLAELGPEL